MVIASLLGYSSHTWTVSIGLLFVFAVIFPVLIQGLIAFAVAQGMGEKRENLRHAGRWGKLPDDE